MRGLCLLLVLGLMGCGYFEKDVDESTPADTSELAAVRAAVPGKVAEYLAAADQVTGWPDPNDCDGVLHAGVARAAGVKQVQIDLAEHESGKVGRRAAPVPCWTAANGDVGSRSETSADMALGYLTALWRDKDLAGVQRLADYGEAHQIKYLGLPAWILGEPYPEQEQRVVLRPGLVGTVGRILYALSGGSDDRSYRDVPNIHSAGGQDYQRRLAALSIVLGGEVDRALSGGDAYPQGDRKPEVPPQYAALVAVTETDFQVLKKLAEIDPQDQFFQAAYARYSGDYAPAYRTLLESELYCPSYTRGSRANCLANWLYAASLLVGDVSGV